jgi:hypothetical protein
MSIGIKIDVSDQAAPVIRAVAKAIQPEQINPIVGRAGTKIIREHLFGLNQSRPNKLGGPRTNFYTGAGRGTNFEVTPSGVLISVVQVGIAQRYYGGRITPKRTKYLTIPVAPEAHGKRASEFKDLEVIFGTGGQPVALATKSTRGVSIKDTKNGKVTKKQIGRFGVVLFLLVKSVNQKPDPTVLPPENTMNDGITKDVNAYVQRAIERAGGAS